jgi:heme A synthase
VVPLWAGVAHQILALLILAMAAVHARLSGRTGHPAVA